MDVEEVLDPSKLALSSELQVLTQIEKKTRAEKANKNKKLKKQSKKILNAGTVGEVGPLPVITQIEIWRQIKKN